MSIVPGFQYLSPTFIFSSFSAQTPKPQFPHAAKASKARKMSAEMAQQPSLPPAAPAAAPPDHAHVSDPTPETVPALNEKRGRPRKNPLATPVADSPAAGAAAADKASEDPTVQKVVRRADYGKKRGKQAKTIARELALQNASTPSGPVPASSAFATSTSDLSQGATLDVSGDVQLGLSVLSLDSGRVPSFQPEEDVLQKRKRKEALLKIADHQRVFKVSKTAQSVGRPRRSNAPFERFKMPVAAQKYFYTTFFSIARRVCAFAKTAGGVTVKAGLCEMFQSKTLRIGALPGPVSKTTDMPETAYVVAGTASLQAELSARLSESQGSEGASVPSSGLVIIGDEPSSELGNLRAALRICGKRAMEVEHERVYCEYTLMTQQDACWGGRGEDGPTSPQCETVVR